MILWLSKRRFQKAGGGGGGGGGIKYDVMSLTGSEGTQLLSDDDALEHPFEKRQHAPNEI